MKCYVCNKKITGKHRVDFLGCQEKYAHPECYVAKSVLNIKPLDVEQFDKTKKMHPEEVDISEYEERLKSIKARKAIEDNTIGQFNE